MISALFLGLTTCIAIVVGAFISWKLLPKKKQKPKRTYPPDIVIIHQFPRAGFAPSTSPFVIKFETYLRIAKIPYQSEFSWEFSSKNKVPWITFNGVDMTDSYFCIQYLNKKFNVDLNKNLTIVEKCVARAFEKMVEENFFWAMTLWRFKFSIEEQAEYLIKTGLNRDQQSYIKRCVAEHSYGHGMGRHNEEEVEQIAEGDLRALSIYLGKKDFFMGDHPTEVDCAIFGQLSIANWMALNSPEEKLVKGELKNLGDYCERMKTMFWPDWEECNTHGGTRNAVK